MPGFGLGFGAAAILRPQAARSSLAELLHLLAGSVSPLFDASDLSSMYQDSAGTTPVATPGDPIGLHIDKQHIPAGVTVAQYMAANKITDPRTIPGEHRSQTSDLKRPLYDTSTGMPGLKFDGSDDFLATAAIDYSGEESVTICSGVRKSSTTPAIFIELRGASHQFGLFAPSSAGADNFSFRSVGTASVDATATGYASPVTAVATGIGRISTDTCIIRVNGVQKASNDGNQGAGNYSSSPIDYGARNGTAGFFRGIEFWSLVTPQIDPKITALAEAIAAAKAGVAL